MLLYGGIIAGAHAGVAMWVLSAHHVASSRRHLAVALLMTLPLVGLALAIATMRARGINASPALNQPASTAGPRRHAPELDVAPVLERLVGAPDERRAALAHMTRADGAQTIGALRWLIDHGESEAVVDAALTLEELADRRMSEVTRMRARAGQGGADWRRLMDTADLIADTIYAGLADPSTVPGLCETARKLYRAACANVAGQPAELTAGWARLELAAMRPHDALVILGETDPTDDEELARRLGRLRTDALFAARERSRVYG